MGLSVLRTCAGRLREGHLEPALRGAELAAAARQQPFGAALTRLGLLTALQDRNDLCCDSNREIVSHYTRISFGVPSLYPLTLLVLLFGAIWFFKISIRA